MYVGLTATVVTPFDRIVEEAIDRVTVVLVVFGGVDTSLCRDRVRPARTIVEGKALDIVAQLTERSGSSSTGQAGTDYDDIEAALIVRGDQRHGRAVSNPFLCQRAGWHLTM